MTTPSKHPIEFTTGPITAEEFSSWAYIEKAAFSASNISPLFSAPSDLSPSELEAQAIARHRKNWETDPTAHYHVARLQPSNKVIGIAKWNFFLDAEKQFPWPKEYGPGTNAEFCKYFFGRLDKERNEMMEGKKHALMAVLAIDPEFQRGGVGRKLLEWGLDKADKEGVELWIDASQYGKGLYEKMGWKEVGVVEVDVGKWGSETGGVNRTVCMIRPVGGKTD
jgi:GNAT superfamily N-acetyltransferase